MSRVKKVFSVLGKILNVFILAVLIAAVASLAYLLLGAKGKSLPFLEDYQIRTVMSGSMEPTLPVGSVVLIKEQPPSAFVAGDIMTFMSNDPALSGKVVSHRVMEVIDSENNGLMFLTKGDANEDPDLAAAIAPNVIGRVVYDVPYLGYVLNFMGTKSGFFLLLMLPCMIILLLEVIGLIRNIRLYCEEKEQLRLEKAQAEELPAEESERETSNATD